MSHELSILLSHRSQIFHICDKSLCSLSRQCATRMDPCSTMPTSSAFSGGVYTLHRSLIKRALYLHYRLSTEPCIFEIKTDTCSVLVSPQICMHTSKHTPHTQNVHTHTHTNTHANIAVSCETRLALNQD